MELTGTLTDLQAIAGLLTVADRTIIYELDATTRNKVGRVLLGHPLGSGAIFHWAVETDRPTESAFLAAFPTAVKVSSVSA